ncbi:kinase-like domain, phloem protein 2-like protein [Tanacetum coccineum]
MNSPNMMFLEKYMDGLRIPYEELALATNNFSDANRIKQATSVELYKGHILQSEEWTNIIARKSQEQRIILNEVMLSYHLEHKNVVSIFKICEDNSDMIIIVNKHEANGSLDNHLSGSSLSWIQRLRICLGVARALSYLHYDIGFGLSVIHGNIKSSKILLNDKWEPKLSGFGFSIILAQSQHLYLSKYNGTPQYMDPAYQTGGLSFKSDVFSFGVLLFEVLFGMVASIQDGDNWYFVRLAKGHYEKKKLDDLIDPDLRQQMNSRSLEIFSKLAYCCLKDMRAQRPDMNQIVKGLERALEHQEQHECPVNSTIEVNNTPSNPLKVENLEYMRIRLSDIEFATENFSDIYEIGSGGFGRVYRAELDHMGNNNSSSIEADNKGELPIKRNTVAIKRIMNRGDSQGEQGFFREVEILSSCKHPNIVSLLGYCDEGGEMILVYEHASNGSLDEYLGNMDNPTNLTWAQRIEICIGIAHGLNYLHSCLDNKQRIIHRDIKSDNILLGDKWEAKIADFGLSKLYNANNTSSTINTRTIAGTDMYLDPEYKKTGKLKKESDIYSLGVVLFEILCGRLAYDKIYYADNEKGLASIVHRRYKDGTIKDMIDPKIKEEAHENIFTENRGLDQDSLDTFLEIAYQCLEETQVKRPKMEVIIMELEKALYFQENSKDDLQISIESINLATKNFSDKNCIERGRYWKAYKGELTRAKGNITIVAKRWDRKCSQGGQQFLKELDILFKCKHGNIISLVGYCKEMDENIIVYEHALKGSLNKYLKDASLTWVKRLKICIDVAVGLDTLHKDHIVTRGPVVHRDIKSTSILIDSGWKAKISNLELSATDPLNQEMEHVINNDFDTLHYLDPSYVKGFLDKASDIYSFGVVLIEILHGTLIWKVDDIEGLGGYHQFLVLAAKMYYDEGKFDRIVFKGIAEQIVPQSLQTFATIAIQCLHHDSNERPTANQVLVQLNKALEFQVRFHIYHY